MKSRRRSRPAAGRAKSTPAAARRAIILTALHVETRAVLRHVKSIDEQTVRGTVFHVGQFEGWTVAVAECGEGNIRAAATIERGIARFNPEVALFVGVAGGIKDVAIGDVLVASKVYGYERGKDTSRGFKARPAVTLPSYTLEQRARAVRLKTDWQLRLNPDLSHESSTIFIGAIAAGEKVVASSRGNVARFLKENYGDALGVEMEGHGFLEGVHISSPVQGCVIRGISDLLDHKAQADKAGSQKLAADAASAATFEILATLEPAAPQHGLVDAIARGSGLAAPPAQPYRPTFKFDLKFGGNLEPQSDAETTALTFTESLENVRHEIDPPCDVLVEGFDQNVAELKKLEASDLRTVESRKRRLALRKSIQPYPYNFNVKELAALIVRSIVKFAVQFGIEDGNQLTKCLIATSDRLNSGARGSSGAVRFDAFITDASNKHQCIAVFYIPSDDADDLAKREGVQLQFLTRFWGLDFWDFRQENRIERIIPALVCSYIELVNAGAKRKLSDDEYFNLGLWRIGIG